VVAEGKDDLVTRVTGNKKKLRSTYDALLAGGKIELVKGLGVVLTEAGRQTQMEGV